jgi:hypothetical protein
VFLRVQQAYERLQVGAAGGQGPQVGEALLPRLLPASLHCFLACVFMHRSGLSMPGLLC